LWSTDNLAIGALTFHQPTDAPPLHEKTEST